MAEEFTDVYYRSSHVCCVSCTGMAKWSNLLQHDLSGRYGVGILLPVFLVSSRD